MHTSDQDPDPGPGAAPRARVLILFAHPAFEKSRVHRQLARAVVDLPGVTFHDLYEAYPLFDVDARREQALLLSHETIVMQHPFFWYSTPALLKQWQDLVLEHGWAYGTGGTALRGKRLLNALSTGGRETAYGRDGLNRLTVRELLAPIEQTARLCGLDFLPPFIVHGTHRMDEHQIASAAAEYRRVVEALRDDRVEIDAVRGWPRLNADLDRALRR